MRRCSDQSDVVVPPGYTELYATDSGLISYHDNVRDVTWLTSLDKHGRLYFYTEAHGRAEWLLPDVPSRLGGTAAEKVRYDDGDVTIASGDVTHSAAMLQRARQRRRRRCGGGGAASDVQRAAVGLRRPPRPSPHHRQSSRRER